MTFYIVSILHISWHFINIYSVQLKGDLWYPKRYLSPSLAQSLDHISDYFVPWVATESSLNDGCVSKRSNNNKKVVYPWKRWITLIAGWAQCLPGEWEECIRVLRRREVIFFSFGVLGTLAKTCWKPLFFYHVQQNQAKSAEKRGKTFFVKMNRSSWRGKMNQLDKGSLSATCVMCANTCKDTPGEMSSRLVLSEQHSAWFWLSRAAALMPREQRELSVIFQHLCGGLYAGEATAPSRFQ